MIALIRRILQALKRCTLHGLTFREEDIWFGPED